MAEDRPRKDAWDILDIVLKGVLAITVSSAVAFYSVYTTNEQNQRSEDNRRSQALIQLINARESASTDLRAKMFSTLLQYYFSREDIEAQIAAVEMIGLNFRDAIQIKPMFEHLDRKLFAASQLEGNQRERTRLAQLKKLLQRAARNIIRDQLTQIGQSSDGYVCRTRVKIDGAVPQECLPYPDVTLRLQAVSNDAIIMRADNGTHSGKPFTVTHYDMPMVDFSNLPGTEQKYSVVLTEPLPNINEAEIALAILPQATFNPRLNAYQFDDMLFEYIGTTTSEP